MHWFVDFDDTLVQGPITWGICRGFPEFIQEHQLPHDPIQLNELLLAAQEWSNQTADTSAVLTALFEALGWPDVLQASLLRKMENEYRPELFDDTRPFLQRVHASGHRVFVVSNNNRAPDQARCLGIINEIDAIFTPRLCPGTEAKPDPSLWAYIVNHHPEVEPTNSAMIGDDPWSDGLFADKCGLPCWIIDRWNRFGLLQPQMTYRSIRSLLDIQLIV